MQLRGPARNTTGETAARLGDGGDVSCAWTAILIDELRAHGGDIAVESTLHRAGSERSRRYLQSPSNWISHQEAIALWDAATRLTHRPSFSRAVGEAAAFRLANIRGEDSVAAAATPEETYRRLVEACSRYSPAVAVELAQCGPGLVEIVARPAPGLALSSYQCDGTIGLLGAAASVFGLPPADVEHEICAALGADECRYRVSWATVEPDLDGEARATAARLRSELVAMRERLHGMFDTASDLVSTASVEDALDRIADRVAAELGARRHLLLVHASPEEKVRIHSGGFTADEQIEFERDLGHGRPPELGEGSLIAPIASGETIYGFLGVVLSEPTRGRPQALDLLDMYARYAAIALDSAAARLRAERRFEQTRALLDLAHQLSAAGTSEEVAQRLADSVSLVVECDEVGVHLWRGGRFALVGHCDVTGERPTELRLPIVWDPRPGEAAWTFTQQPERPPIYIAADTDNVVDFANLAALGLAAAVVVPLVERGRLLGILHLSVRRGARRLRENVELTRRVEGVAAQATTALENARLIDVVIHQAHHDQLTGLANRARFTTDLNAAVASAATAISGERSIVALFYLDLELFKPVNDRYGHEIGDELLIAIAARLRERIRDGDTVARLGGDEFAIVARARAEGELSVIQSRIAEVFDAPFQIRGRELVVFASIGRAVYPIDATDPDALIRVADAAMYADKESHPGRRGVRPNSR